jgi:osmotically-inducible protein OsmY
LFRPYSTELNPPVHVVVNNETVILEGFVDSTGERGFLGSQVTFRTGAFNVVNHLQVVPD